MNVYVPYTVLSQPVLDALAATGSSYTGVDVSGSDSAYCELLQELWARQESFVIVEHDVLVRPDTLQELAVCPNNWCGFPVPYMGTFYPGMACAKFEQSLIGSNPFAMEQVARMSDDTHRERHWCRLDAWLQYIVLPRGGAQRHIHDPPLGHYRADGTAPWPSHGCVKKE